MSANPAAAGARDRASDGYSPSAIEPHWQARWSEAGIGARPARPRRPYYALTMYPYPSGNLHIGHWYAYSAPDTHARYRRMRGEDVFFPFGFDAFGLPAENAAIRHGVHPRAWTLANIDRMREQMRTMGTVIDWDAEVITCLPEYYRWNQWFFLRFLERGLAYRKRAAVDFCPSCNTTLAREQVTGDDRVCERCGTPVTKKDLTQWFLRITDYAEELLSGLDDLDWPERVKTMQRNWIGRSEGAEIDFRAADGTVVTVFTTRPDTLFGATAVVLAPEHPAVAALTSADRADEVATYSEQAQRRTEIDRLAEDRTKTGVALGGTVRHPLSGVDLPVWMADYVLPTYGTGAVMLVPAHDARDHAFALSYGLPVLEVIRPAGEAAPSLPHTGPGTLVASGPFDGLVTTGKLSRTEWAADAGARHGLPAQPDPEAKAAITTALEAAGCGRAAITYRLRDWLISRQRYWGTPIPVVHCPDCGTVPVPDADLPVELPDGVEFRPTGESPLHFADAWRVVPCPSCGAPAERETDTMDTFVDSSWYQYRYLSPHFEEGPFEPEASVWLPVRHYTGGIEHATMHLLYTRFWTRAMRDMGLVAFDEPMTTLVNQGVILGKDTEKMSKSRGNVVDPDDLVARHGADAVRLYLMFIGPWDQGGPWDPRGIQGVVRFLHDTWELVVGPAAEAAGRADERLERDLVRATHATLAAVADDLEAFAFNTAIATLMAFRNTLRSSRGAVSSAVWADATRTMVLMVAPFAPHIAEEMWSRLGQPFSVHAQAWPEADRALATPDRLEIAVQVDGKVRGRIELPADAAEETAVAAALAQADVQRALAGRAPSRVVYVPGRLVSLVF